MSAQLPEHVAENRRCWDAIAGEWAAAGARAWAQTEPTWGNWSVPESELRLLPDRMVGMDAIELGCGTAYVSAWMVRRGARVVGIDNSERQLETARRLAAEHGVQLDLLHGSAEAVDLPDASFDFAISEYGAAIWCDPHMWVPEAARLLRGGGRLVFLGNHPIATMCLPVDGSELTDRLAHSYFGMHRFDWRDAAEAPGGIEFNLPVSEWLALFDRCGLDVVRYDEVRAPEGSEGVRYGVPAEWARRWPVEQVWHLCKR